MAKESDTPDAVMTVRTIAAVRQVSAIDTALRELQIRRRMAVLRIPAPSQPRAVHEPLAVGAAVTIGQILRETTANASFETTRADALDIWGRVCGLGSQVSISA